MGNTAKILSGPAGYALVIVVAGVAVYLAYRAIKAPAQAAYTGLQNFDNNVGLAPFDAWVSNLFSPQAPTTP